jgi:hypothetical protein
MLRKSVSFSLGYITSIPPGPDVFVHRLYVLRPHEKHGARGSLHVRPQRLRRCGFFGHPRHVVTHRRWALPRLPAALRVNMAIGLNGLPEHRRPKVPCKDARSLELHSENGSGGRRRCFRDEQAGVML